MSSASCLVLLHTATHFCVDLDLCLQIENSIQRLSARTQLSDFAPYAPSAPYTLEVEDTTFSMLHRVMLRCYETMIGDR